MENHLSHSEIEQIIDEQERELDILNQAAESRDMKENQSDQSTKHSSRCPISRLSNLWKSMFSQSKDA